MRYTIKNSIRIVEVPAKDFRVILYDGKKKSMGKNRCNAGFFGNFTEQGETFTLPVGHLVADYAAASKRVEFYCQQRGTIQNGRVRHDAGGFPNDLKGKDLTTLVVSGGQANMMELANVPVLCDYAISGVPVMRDGQAASYREARAQGWDGSPLYATQHIFVGLKGRDASSIYVMAMKTSSINLLSSKEAYRKFAALGMRDVIKLDGGGSFYFNAAGNELATSENRRVCTILDFGQDQGNPYAEPTTSLRRGTGNTAGVFWLQWELAAHGYKCELDGIFGPDTEKMVKAFQRDHGLDEDGICGPATRAALKK